MISSSELIKIKCIPITKSNPLRVETEAPFEIHFALDESKTRRNRIYSTEFNNWNGMRRHMISFINHSNVKISICIETNLTIFRFLFRLLLYISHSIFNVCGNTLCLFWLDFMHIVGYDILNLSFRMFLQH